MKTARSVPIIVLHLTYIGQRTIADIVFYKLLLGSSCLCMFLLSEPKIC